MTGANSVSIEGTIVERDVLRRTPAGIPILRFRLAHDSAQTEAGSERKVQMEIGCVAVEGEAELIARAPVGIAVSAQGFIAPKGKSSRQLVLHVQRIEFRAATSGT